MIKIKPLLANLAISLGTGALSAFLTRDGMRAYDMAAQPPLSPPDWVFVVVWTILFALMGIAAYMIWTADEDEPGRERALWLYGIQLAFNFLWSLIFFNTRMYGFALVWIVILWALILMTTVSFWRIRPAAGRLMLPYLIWVTFAIYLNAGVWVLNG